MINSLVMSITWRPAVGDDIEPCLALQPRNFGDALLGRRASLQAWKQIADDRFFASAVLQAAPPIRGFHLIGFGASVIVTPEFMNIEVKNPQPDVTSRIIYNIQQGFPCLATAGDVAHANAGDGVDVVVLAGNWRDDVITPEERHEVQTTFVFSFADWLSGYRIRRILYETVDEPATAFVQGSTEYRVIGEFPELGRHVHLMTRESATTYPSSIGNAIFKFTEPTLRLTDSDQQLLLSALHGSTDVELAEVLGITPAAVKARWRSVFARIAKSAPDLVGGMEDNRDHRGKQKRYRVLSYVRAHREELRPYAWNVGRAHNSLAASS